MYMMEIFLFVDKIEDAKTVKKILNQGDADTWGWVGWVVLIIIIFFIYIFLRDLWKQKQKRERYLKEKGTLEEKYRDINYKISKKEKLIKESKEQHHKKKGKQELKKMYSERDDIYRQLKQCGDEVKTVESEIDQLKDRILKHKKGIIISTLIIIFIFILDSSNMIVAAKELGQTLKNVLENEESLQQQTEKPISKSTKTEDDEKKRKNLANISSIKKVRRENMDYNFILEDDHLNETLENIVMDTIFLADDTMNNEGFILFLTDCRQGGIEEILQEKYDGDLGIKGLLDEIAEDFEKPFLKKLEDGKLIQLQAEWEQSGPRSTELENIINKRRQALWLKESTQFRRNIYFRLANDYQRFGDECLIQEKSGNSIYYYYGMSIYCCYCALGYARTNENDSDEEILNYIKGRYKDIMDNESKGIPKNVVNKAEKMYWLVSF